MGTDLQFELLDRTTYERSPSGSLALRRSAGPRVLGAAVGGAVSGILALAFTPVVVAVAIGAAGVALTYVALSRPIALFDLENRHLVLRSTRLFHVRLSSIEIPFESLGRFHTIERRDERSRVGPYAEMLVGSELVIRHEVYTRFQGEPLVLTDFLDKAEASELVGQINRVIGAASD